MALGALPGVVNTRAGWLEGKEVENAPENRIGLPNEVLVFDFAVEASRHEFSLSRRVPPGRGYRVMPLVRAADVVRRLVALE